MLAATLAVIAIAACFAAITARVAGRGSVAREQSVDEFVRLVAVRIARSALLCIFAFGTAIGTRLLPVHVALMTPHPVGALVSRGIVIIAARVGWLA